MFFGRVVTRGKKFDAPWFIEVVDTYTPSTDLPTAILGKKNAEEIFGKENVHLLDRDINDTTVWIYGKVENRSKHDEEKRAFFEKCFTERMSSVDYQFINIFTAGYSYIKKFIRYIDSDRKKSVYVTDKHIYIYSGKSVAGISLSDCRYIGISPKRVVARISENPANIVFEDDSFIEKEDKKFLKGNKILVPVIHFNSNSTFSE